jgi:ankyrin repeat protein
MMLGAKIRSFLNAASEGNLEELNRLLGDDEIKNNITADNNSALGMAAANGHLAIVEKLLTYKKVVNEITARDNAALGWAAKYGHLAIVEKLLTYEVVVNAITANNNYALRWAAANGHLATVEELLTYEVVVNAITADNNYALRWAAKNQHWNVVILLANASEDVAKYLKEQLPDAYEKVKNHLLSGCYAVRGMIKAYREATGHYFPKYIAINIAKQAGYPDLTRSYSALKEKRGQKRKEREQDTPENSPVGKKSHTQGEGKQSYCKIF